MNPGFKILLSAVILSILNNSVSECQQIKVSYDKPVLKDTGWEIENSVSLYIPKATYDAIKDTSTGKFSFKVYDLIINGDTINPEGVETRGKSSLLFRRKSFTFRLSSKASFHHGERTASFKKFFALSLSMDRNYSNNHLAFEIMEAARLFDLFYAFCVLSINDQCEGIYMIVERPEDWATKKESSPLFIRRGYDHRIDKLEVTKETGIEEVKKYRNYYNQIYRSLNRYEGEELYTVLAGWLDMDIYMKWLAFNFLVRNSDYTDEVYFYIDPVIDKFKIIPWDYDDIFSSAPHEGIDGSKRILGDKMIFSAEDKLDRKIATDAYLYKVYLEKFRELLNLLSPSVLKRVFEDTYAELYPYYSDKEVIGMSRYDLYRNRDLAILQKEMYILYDKLRSARDFCLDYLKTVNQDGK